MPRKRANRKVSFLPHAFTPSPRDQRSVCCIQTGLKSEPQKHWRFFLQHQVYSSHMLGVLQGWRIDTLLLTDQPVPPLLGGLFFPVHFWGTLPKVGYNDGKHLESYQTTTWALFNLCKSPETHRVSSSTNMAQKTGKRHFPRLAATAAFGSPYQTSERSFALDPLKSFGLQSQQFDMCTFVWTLLQLNDRVSQNKTAHFTNSFSGF